MNTVKMAARQDRRIRQPGKQSFARIVYIHGLIKAQHYPNVPRIAETLEVSRRTVERDLEYLRDYLKAPLSYSKFKNGYYYESQFDLPPVKLTEGEAVALVMSQHLFSLYKGAPFGKTVKSAIEKLTCMLPASVTLDPSEFLKQVSFDVKTPRGEEQHLCSACHFVSEAISEKKTLKITYYTASRDDTLNRCIDPYHLRYHQGAWYIIAFCHFRNEVRIFSLDRLLSYEETGETFTIPDDFSLEDFLKYSMGIEIGTVPVEVAVHFDAYIARFVRDQIWHSSQEIESLPDGSIILKMTISGLGEVKRWVLSYGIHVEVLYPESLRLEIAQEAADLAGLYEKRDATPTRN